MSKGQQHSAKEGGEGRPQLPESCALYTKLHSDGYRFGRVSSVLREPQNIRLTAHLCWGHCPSATPGVITRKHGPGWVDSAWLPLPSRPSACCPGYFPGKWGLPHPKGKLQGTRQGPSQDSVALWLQLRCPLARAPSHMAQDVPIVSPYGGGKVIPRVAEPGP